MLNALRIKVSVAKIQEHLVHPISTYKLSLLEYGHIPNRLSGAKSRYASRYASSRDVLTRALHTAYGIAHQHTRLRAVYDSETRITFISETNVNAQVWTKDNVPVILDLIQ